jgi:hypothetical protein
MQRPSVSTQAAGHCKGNTKQANEAHMTEINVSTIFPDRIDKRTQVVFRELLGMTVKYASLHPDKDALDLIARARAIAEAFDSGSK